MAESKKADSTEDIVAKFCGKWQLQPPKKNIYMINSTTDGMTLVSSFTNQAGHEFDVNILSNGSINFKSNKGHHVFSIDDSGTMLEKKDGWTKKWIRVAGGGMKATPKKNAIEKTKITLTGAKWLSIMTIPAGEANKRDITSTASYEQSTKDSSSKESTHEWSVDVEQNYEIFGSKGKIQGHYGGGVKSLNASVNSMVNSKLHTEKQEYHWQASDVNRQLFQLQLEGVDEAGNPHYWTSTQHRICVPMGDEIPHVSTVLEHM